jgi:nicotinamidase-related amidase
MNAKEGARVESDTALLVVDVQVGMFDGPDGPVHGGEHLLEKVAALIRKARDAGASVIYVQHCEGAGEIFEPDTRWWQIHPSIAPLDGEPVVEKRTPDSFLDTKLAEELEARGINRLVLTGMQTEYCVDTTCRRAFGLGYDVTLVKDAHGTWDTDRLTATQIVAHHNEVLGGSFARVVEADAGEFEGTAVEG